jgi:hypothetical protein
MNKPLDPRRYKQALVCVRQRQWAGVASAIALPRDLAGMVADYCVPEVGCVHSWCLERDMKGALVPLTCDGNTLGLAIQCVQRLRQKEVVDALHSVWDSTQWLDAPLRPKPEEYLGQVRVRTGQVHEPFNPSTIRFVTGKQTLFILRGDVFMAPIDDLFARLGLATSLKKTNGRGPIKSDVS